MSSALRGNVKMALASMRNTRWRSFLTMLGIIIGVASVVTVVSLGEGIKREVNGQIDQLGRDLITIRPGELRPGGESEGLRDELGSISVVLGPGSGGSLDDRDIRSVAETAGVGQAAPLSLVQGEVAAGDRKLAAPLVLGTTPELSGMLRDPVEHGDFFTAESVREEPNVAIVGPNVAHTLFGQRVPIGRSFEFLGNTFIVQGVLKRFDTTPLSLATDFNDTIFIPYDTARVLTANNTRLYQILARPAEPGKLDETVKAINDKLAATHRGQQSFSVLRQDESLNVTRNILDLLTKLITAIAAISLLVGGIGIMNVMLVSVAERMHEIGIRKALGASNRQIMMQFMAEATVLSFIGALIGIILALAIAFVVSVTTPITPVITWQPIVIAAAVSVATGILFGTAPAAKAARKDPIEALRNE
jgi:ABC-type antimicrobial peptide transport system permease subunit